MLGTRTCGDKHTRGLRLDVRSVPGTRSVDGVVADVEPCSDLFAIDLLHKLDRSGGAENNLCPAWMHFPHIPRFGKGMHRRQPALDAVGGVAFSIAHIPLHLASEDGLDFGGCSETEMNWALSKVVGWVAAHTLDTTTTSCQRVEQLHNITC